jgi:hypothetical protein
MKFFHYSKHALVYTVLATFFSLFGAVEIANAKTCGNRICYWSQTPAYVGPGGYVGKGCAAKNYQESECNNTYEYYGPSNDGTYNANPMARECHYDQRAHCVANKDEGAKCVPNPVWEEIPSGCNYVCQGDSNGYYWCAGHISP